MSRRPHVHIKSTRELRRKWGEHVDAVHAIGCVHSPLFPKSKALRRKNMRLWLPDNTHIDFATWVDDDKLCREEIALYQEVLRKFA